MPSSSNPTLEVRRIRCSFQEILADALIDVEPRAIGKGVAIETEFCGAPLEPITTAPDHLRQLLTGLISGAVRRTAAVSLLLLVRAEDDTEVRPTIRLDLLDPMTRRGLGRADAEAGAAGTLPESGEQSATHPAKSGFSTWIQLARSLGGDLAIDWFASGTRYRLTVATGPPSDEDHRPTGGAAPEARPGREWLLADQEPILHDRHVLLVEDNPDHRPLLSLMLRKSGCRVTVAENGEVALDRVRDLWGHDSNGRDSKGNGHPIDIVLMDIQMPVLDGPATTRLLRASGFDRPIVALTARSIESDRQECLDAGCNGFLSKPVDREDLVLLLASQLAD